MVNAVRGGGPVVPVATCSCGRKSVSGSGDEGKNQSRDESGVDLTRHGILPFFVIIWDQCRAKASPTDRFHFWRLNFRNGCIAAK